MTSSNPQSAGGTITTTNAKRRIAELDVKISELRRSIAINEADVSSLVGDGETAEEDHTRDERQKVLSEERDALTGEAKALEEEETRLENFVKRRERMGA